MSIFKNIVARDIIEHESQPKYYVPTYCNFQHVMNNGRPINHECRYLHPAALRLERAGLYDEAIELLQRKET